MCNSCTSYPIPLTMHSIEVNFICKFPFTGTEIMHLTFYVLKIMISGIIQCTTEGVHFSNPLIHQSSWITQQKPTILVQCLIFVIHFFSIITHISFIYVCFDNHNIFIIHFCSENVKILSYSEKWFCFCLKKNLIFFLIFHSNYTTINN